MLIEEKQRVALRVEHADASGMSHPQGIAHVVIGQRNHRRLQQFLRTLAVTQQAYRLAGIRVIRPYAVICAYIHGVLAVKGK